MTGASLTAGSVPAAVSSTSGRRLSLPGWEETRQLERERLIAEARGRSWLSVVVGS